MIISWESVVNVKKSFNFLRTLVIPIFESCMNTRGVLALSANLPLFQRHLHDATEQFCTLLTLC